MNEQTWELYRLQLEGHYLSGRNHYELASHVISDLIKAVYMAHSPEIIKSVSSFLPYNYELPSNAYTLRGKGRAASYQLLDVDFVNQEKSLIQILHFHRHESHVTSTFKYGRIIDAMLRLRSMANHPQFAGTSTYLVLITDSAMINYLNGIVFTDKLIDIKWINEQKSTFTYALSGAFSALQKIGQPIQATVINPLFQPDGENFGTCIWQIK